MSKCISCKWNEIFLNGWNYICNNCGCIQQYIYVIDTYDKENIVKKWTYWNLLYFRSILKNFNSDYEISTILLDDIKNYLLWNDLKCWYKTIRQYLRKNKLWYKLIYWIMRKLNNIENILWNNIIDL